MNVSFSLLPDDKCSLLSESLVNLTRVWLSLFLPIIDMSINDFKLIVREIAKTVYIRSCDMIGRGKTKTNHIGREGLKRVK